MRNALLDAAVAIVAEHGIAGVTMSKVAQRSGVSSGAPYRHFTDRVDLLRAVSERAQETLAERLMAAAADAPTPLEGFRRTGVEYVRFAVDEPALFTVLSRGEFTQRESDGVRNPGDVEFAAALEALLAHGDRTAPLDPTNPIIQQLAARCMVHGLAHYFVDGLLAVIGVGPDQAGRVAEAMTSSLGPPKV
ncbi:MAG: TetR/AcrR family transcriptional regulator [Myxococcota bacterium]